MLYSNVEFQSTRPRGARPTLRVTTFSKASFNPRARVGRDLKCSGEAVCRAGFNPRARVGRDTTGSLQTPTVRSFNPRARVGRDCGVVARLLAGKVSIHAPAWGAT